MIGLYGNPGNKITGWIRSFIINLLSAVKFLRGGLVFVEYAAVGIVIELCILHPVAFFVGDLIDCKGCLFLQFIGKKHLNIHQPRLTYQLVASIINQLN